MSESASQIVTEASAPRFYADMVRGFEGMAGGDVNSNHEEEFLDNKRDRSDDESSQLHADKRGKPERNFQSEDLFSSPEDQRSAANVHSDEAVCEDPNYSIKDRNNNDMENIENDNTENSNDIINNKSTNNTIPDANEVDMNVNDNTSIDINISDVATDEAMTNNKGNKDVVSEDETAISQEDVVVPTEATGDTKCLSFVSSS